jgi:CYTH domain-containing protein
MVVERRFLIASSLARLIRRERGVTTRIVEGHFPPRPDRSQFVRVERDECFLVLRAKGKDGEFRTERSQVPLAHAEALVDVAPGRVAFDRTELPLGMGAEGTLDRFIVPSGLDLVTVQISSDPRLFAPPLWFGREVTDDTRVETGQLALNGWPEIHPGEVSNTALETFLDWVDGRSVYSSRSAVHSGTAAAGERGDARHGLNDGVEGQAAQSTVLAGDVLPPATEAAVADLVELAVSLPRAAQASETGAEQIATLAPAEEDAPDERAPGPRRPTLRGDVPELEDGIVRLARSLAPKRFRSLANTESVP